MALMTTVGSTLAPAMVVPAVIGAPSQSELVSRTAAAVILAHADNDPLRVILLVAAFVGVLLAAAPPVRQPPPTTTTTTNHHNRNPHTH